MPAHGAPDGRDLAERLRAVLAAPGSPLALLARAVLTGTEAALRTGARTAASDDPARAACADLADALAALLDTPPAGSAAQPAASAGQPAASAGQPGATGPYGVPATGSPAVSAGPSAAFHGPPGSPTGSSGQAGTTGLHGGPTATRPRGGSATGPSVVSAGPSQAPSGPPGVPAGSAAGTPAGAGADVAGDTPLAGLAREFAADPRVAPYLGRAAGFGGGDADTWRALQAACLRLDPETAAEWRRRARAVRDGYGAAEPAAWLEVPGLDAAPAVLIEPAFGIPGVREVPGAAPDPELTVALPPAEARLAALVTLAVRIATVDPGTCHALEGLRTSGLHRLGDPATWAAYRAELARRLAAFAAAPAGSAAALRGHRLVDEAVCSLVHRPPAHPRSWWAGLARYSRDLLREHVRRARSAGLDAELRVLELKPYAELRGYCGGRDIAYQAGRARTGEILACLRTWLRIEGDTLPGRVIYGGE